MKVLTLKEPFASLIGEGIKTIETRSWKTNYRGEIFIHASKSKIDSNDESVRVLLNAMTGQLHYETIFLKCNLVDCILIDKDFAYEAEQSNKLNYLAGDYSEGRYAWVLEDVEYIPAITAKGKLGLWNYYGNR